MFPDALKSLRKVKKLNQAVLAEQLDVSRSAIATWESGKRQPDFETLCRIADFFNVTTDYLLGRTPMDASPKPEAPPPPFDEDKRRLQSTLDEAPQKENNLERLIRNLIRQEVQQELEKRGL